MKSYIKPLAMTEEKFKPFWVKEVNNWITDAAYSGKLLKEKSPVPSFRKYHFIRSWDELKYFTPHEEVSNVDLVKQCLKENNF